VRRLRHSCPTLRVRLGEERERLHDRSGILPDVSKEILAKQRGNASDQVEETLLLPLERVGNLIVSLRSRSVACRVHRQHQLGGVLLPGGVADLLHQNALTFVEDGKGILRFGARCGESHVC